MVFEQFIVCESKKIPREKTEKKQKKKNLGHSESFDPSYLSPIRVLTYYDIIILCTPVVRPPRVRLRSFAGEKRV